MPDRRSSHVVKHEYTDHGAATNNGMNTNPRGGVAVAFPIKLHEMLDKIEKDGHADVVSWQPHGRCFLVHKPKEFAEHVMPTYFKMSKFPSFLRQLNLYGFRRLTRNGSDKGGYYHELFLRNKVFLSYRIPRMRVKGNGVRARSNPESEPDFYNLPSIGPNHGPPTFPQEVQSKCSAMDEERIYPLSNPTATLKRIMSSDELDFAGRRFHSVSEDTTQHDGLDDEILSRSEMDMFLGRLNISHGAYDDICRNIENDFDFGNMMERLMSI